ncbi:fucolectin-1-like [Branchiostoma floridae]|uniref:Fucolectin-1-like n=1 Tax=Branchiostoma floridae TaxID=7739 RepID=A0A9J7MSB9_BRAFL|nr:fucolectin-1-like [Branchiostoma floridae]
MATRLLLTFGVVFLVGRTVSTEVVSDDNVALGKPAFQTSTWGPGEPSRAVDGRTSSRMDAGSCTHTAGHPGEDNPTWWVDLGQSYAVDSVVIFNRMDSWSERLNPFNILIGDSDQVSTNPQCGGDHQIDLAKPFISVSCQGMRGRFVAVRLPGPSRILTLCEVRVFAGSASTSGKLVVRVSVGVKKSNVGQPGGHGEAEDEFTEIYGPGDKHKQAFYQRLNQQRETGHLCDVAVVVEGQRFSAHR